MKEKYILSLDIGTTRVSASLFNHDCESLFSFSNQIQQYSPYSGWYEEDPQEIWEKVLDCVTNLLIINKIKPTEIAALGISNQRETTIIWNKFTGKPIHRALVWESRQTEAIAQSLIDQGYSAKIHEKTGLFIDPYFSATKIMWVLNQVSDAKYLANKGNLIFGTIDTWIAWKLSGGKLHITDYTNASRTMLFNINTLDWDDDILEILDIPRSMLPEVRSNSEVYGTTDPDSFFGASVPIASLAGDQQAALVGSLATNIGEVEGTFGTGAFLIMNTGSKLIFSNQHLLSTIAYCIDGKVTYAIEGSIFVAGSALQWLKDGLGLIDNIAEVEALARQSTDNGLMYVVPSFTGLSAPYWAANAHAATFGMTQKSTKFDYVRATLDSIAYETNDILSSMVQDSNIKIRNINVNGEVVKNGYLPQFMADISGTQLQKSTTANVDALGIAYLAGLAVNFWEDFDDIKATKIKAETFLPEISAEKRHALYLGWRKAVKAVEFYTQ